jgi:hypothetical protein
MRSCESELVCDGPHAADVRSVASDANTHPTEERVPYHAIWRMVYSKTMPVCNTTLWTTLLLILSPGHQRKYQHWTADGVL